MRIALDAMGGDHGPAPNVGGAALALAANPDLTIVLVGDEGQLAPLLAAAALPAGRVEVVDAPVVVEMREKPTDALRRKPKASIFCAWNNASRARSSSICALRRSVIFLDVQISFSMVPSLRTGLMMVSSHTYSSSFFCIR